MEEYDVENYQDIKEFIQFIKEYKADVNEADGIQTLSSRACSRRLRRLLCPVRLRSALSSLPS